tara:strand:- start:143 stop:394 length:252 start_codon:yes stop_codon:yes gene_type:complete
LAYCFASETKGGSLLNAILKNRIEIEVYNIEQPFTSIMLRVRMIEIYGTKFAGNTRSIGYALRRMKNIERVGTTEWRVRDGNE